MVRCPPFAMRAGAPSRRAGHLAGEAQGLGRGAQGLLDRPPLTLLHEQFQGFGDRNPNELVIDFGRLCNPLAQPHLEEGALLGVVGGSAGEGVLRRRTDLADHLHRASALLENFALQCLFLGLPVLGSATWEEVARASAHEPDPSAKVV